MADTTLTAGEALVSLPRTTCLLVGERQPSPFPGFAPAPFWNTQSLHVRLALVLLFQRRLAERGASSSQIRPWMDVLPASHADKPCRWSDAELAELCDPVLVEEIENQRQAIDAIHSQLLAVGGGRWDKVALRGGMSGKDPLQDPSQTVTVSDFRWAMDTVISRTFGAQLPLVATPGVWQTALMVVLSGLGRAWPWLCRVGPTEWRRVMDATATSQEVLILEPVVDMLNHETRALSETRYDASADTITIASSDDAWQPGQQVMICYGSKTNRKLLTNYGFVEEDNPVDATLLPGGVARARAVLLTALCQPAAGTAAPGVAADGTDVEQVWRSRVQTLSRCDGLSDADKVLVTAAGPSSRAVAGLGLLLCDQDEFSAFAAAVAGLDEGACKSALMAASFGLDCQLRVYETVKGMCAWVRGGVDVHARWHAHVFQVCAYGPRVANARPLHRRNQQSDRRSAGASEAIAALADRQKHLTHDATHTHRPLRRRHR